MHPYVVDKLTPKTPAQKRSRDRYDLILNTTKNMLEQNRGYDISIYDIAKNARIPGPSIYRFFPSTEAIILSIAKTYLNEIQTALTVVAEEKHNSWQDYFHRSSDIARQFYRRHPLSMKLIFGWSLPEVKLVDKQAVTDIATDINRSLSEAQLIPTIEGLLKHTIIAIEINDAIWKVSYERHRDITDFYFEESFQALISYLGLYLPKMKPNGLIGMS
ncbi:MAG: TetR/AcrR family transcriptional regulator [Kangiellaceae bacterium]|nr:TetR/AcrR family transcriptional regulator [Kangiellaceae bacterium]